MSITVPDQPSTNKVKHDEAATQGQQTEKKVDFTNDDTAPPHQPTHSDLSATNRTKRKPDNKLGIRKTITKEIIYRITQEDKINKLQHAVSKKRIRQ